MRMLFLAGGSTLMLVFFLGVVDKVLGAAAAARCDRDFEIANKGEWLNWLAALG